MCGRAEESVEHEPEGLALEIAGDLQAAMELFEGIAADLKE